MESTQVEQLVNSIIAGHQKCAFTKSKLITGYASQKYFQRVQVIESSFSILLALQLLTLSIYFQLDLRLDAYACIFNHLSSAFGVILAIKLILRYFCFQQFEQVNKNGSESLSYLLLRVVLLLIMPYSFTEDIYVDLYYPDSVSYQQTEYSLKLNYILIIVCIFRSCFFFASFFIGSAYMSPRAGRICNMYGAKPGPKFALRSIFKDSPFLFISTIFFISVLLFSFMFRIAEYQIHSVSPITIYGNMAWMTVITMTSVGYGNYSPKTPIGRLIGALCVSWGVLIVSVMVLVLTNAFSMTRSQSQSLNILRKLEKNSQLRQVASEYIRQSVWRLWKNYRFRMRLKTQMNERKMMLNFRKYRRMRDMAQISEYDIDFFNEMVRQFERAFINLDNLTSNNLKIINYLNEEYLFKKGLAGERELMLLKD